MHRTTQALVPQLSRRCVALSSSHNLLHTSQTVHLLHLCVAIQQQQIAPAAGRDTPACCERAELVLHAWVQMGVRQPCCCWMRKLWPLCGHVQTSLRISRPPAIRLSL